MCLYASSRAATFNVKLKWSLANFDCLIGSLTLVHNYTSPIRKFCKKYFFLNFGTSVVKCHFVTFSVAHRSRFFISSRSAPRPGGDSPRTPRGLRPALTGKFTRLIVGEVKSRVIRAIHCINSSWSTRSQYQQYMVLSTSSSTCA